MISKKEVRILLEADEEDNQYNPTKDKSEYNIDNQRRTYITLASLNKLKHIRIKKRAELMQDASFIPVLYGPQPEEDMGGGMPAGL